MRSLSPPRPTGPAPTRPLPLLAGLVLGVLLAHLLLLAGLPAGMGGDDSTPQRAISVRQLVLPTPAVPAAPAAAPAPPAVAKPPRPKPAAAATPEPRAEPAALPPAPEPAPLATPDAAPPPPDITAAAAEPVVPAASAPDAAPAPAQAAAPVPSVPPGDAPPTYATRVPPAVTLRYELRRGLLSGQGDLTWRPSAQGYELQIEGVAFGLSLLGWGSSGSFDAAGLAPQRFVDRRRGRDVRAANFQRDKGVISWSGVTVDTPLAAGAQDRLSWMLQLAAILEADPARFVAGERVVMQVAGARGDADVWTFVVGAREGVDVAGSRIEGALQLRREPRKPYDTGVDVWMDPTRHHLPVRLKLSTAGGGDSLEFLLKP